MSREAHIATILTHLHASADGVCICAIAFADEPDKLWDIRAVGPRFSIATRYVTWTEAGDGFDAGGLWYTIIDRLTNRPGPHNIIFNDYDVALQDDCDRMLQDLEAGRIEMSSRPSRWLPLEIYYESEI